MRMGRIPEAKSLIDAVRDSSAEIEFGDELFTKSYDRAGEMLAEENKAPRNANRNHSHVPPSSASVRQTEMRQQRFVGILSLLYIVAFLAKNKSECLQEEWGVLEKSPEAALDVDQAIFVAVLW
ncbi:hypothetical protein HID58_019807 [Brassica napus]|uniref:Uncharacterized protein n=1 Tax=Brassica napus TaxID=3708 RepID=A0ABQ8DDW1_BRANA|nr:hypothetical protein HID58_035177 [Brassica napus]KAH0927551.1 hypothetical protein HID58_019807 [Brassica napus]